MNRDVLEHIADAERAAGEGRWGDAFRSYVEAGDVALDLQLHRGAQRCYRRALEIDLLGAPALERLIGSCQRARTSPEPWQRYLAAVPTLAPLWAFANARQAQLVVDDDGAMIRHPASDGPVARVKMGNDLDVVVIRSPPFTAMPDPMLLILLRRTLWHAPREQPENAVPVVVHATDTGATYKLFETGDWE